MGLREEKRLATRRAIEDAARLLIAERPPERVTIDDIAAVAGVSRRTFFNYFDSKEQVLTAGLDRSAALVAAIRSRPADEDPWTALTRALLVVQPTAGETAAHVESLRHLMAEPALLHQVATTRIRLEHAVAAELLARQPDWDPLRARTTAGVFLTTVRVAIRTWADEGGAGSPVDVITRALELVGSGLAGSD